MKLVLEMNVTGHFLHLAINARLDAGHVSAPDEVCAQFHPRLSPSNSSSALMAKLSIEQHPC